MSYVRCTYEIRGWNANLTGEKRRLKSSLIEQIASFEQQQDSNTLSPSNYSHWQDCQSNLHRLFKEEEIFWHQRSRLKWFLEGDSNTKFFNIAASNRKRKMQFFH